MVAEESPSPIDVLMKLLSSLCPGPQGPQSPQSPQEQAETYRRPTPAFRKGSRESCLHDIAFHIALPEGTQDGSGSGDWRKPLGAKAPKASERSESSEGLSKWPRSAATPAGGTCMASFWAPSRVEGSF